MLPAPEYPVEQPQYHYLMGYGAQSDANAYDGQNAQVFNHSNGSSEESVDGFPELSMF